MVWVSQVVAAVRKVEALVAEWEIGYLLMAQRAGQSEPVVERRIFDLIPDDLPVGTCHGCMAYLAAPAFDQGDGERAGSKGMRNG